MQTIEENTPNNIRYISAHLASFYQQDMHGDICQTMKALAKIPSRITSGQSAWVSKPKELKIVAPGTECPVRIFCR